MRKLCFPNDEMRKAHLRARKKITNRRSRDKLRKQDPIGYERRCRSGILQANYGITIIQYDAMLAAQNNVCAICGRNETALWKGVVRRLAVDHDHETGEVRGLLCHQCNLGLGHFEDDRKLLQNAINYLGEE